LSAVATSSPGAVLLAGAGGFIGSHLADRLIAEGHRVIGIDNFLTGRHANLAHLANESRFDLIEHDISEPLALKTRLDWVMHFASPASPPKYLRWPLQTLRANSSGTHALLALARRSRAKFFLASTSEVYGDALTHPQAEGYWGNVNPIGPRSVYDEAKRYAEAVTLSHHREYGQPVRVIRIFNTYGARMDAFDGRVVSNFIRQGLFDEPLTLYGDGTQTRSLQHIDDLIEAIVRLMRTDYPLPLNIGNPEELRILDMARLIAQLTTGKCANIVFKPLPDDDPKRRCPDIHKARQMLGWSPQVNPEQGLTEVIAYFRRTLKTPLPVTG
jgi:nucleoside-diphosphate-sugar epimerase